MLLLFNPHCLNASWYVGKAISGNLDSWKQLFEEWSLEKQNI